MSSREEWKGFLQGVCGFPFQEDEPGSSSPGQEREQGAKVRCL